MSLVTVQRSPSSDSASVATCSDSEDEEDGLDELGRSRTSSFEGFFASKSAAFAIPDGDFVRKASSHGGEMRIHLQGMVNLLRDEDTMRLAVKLESYNPKRTRYLTVVCSTGICDSEECIILGIDWMETCTVGFVLPIWRDTSIKLDGDGGIKVASGGGRDFIFKPVSVQTMWTALQWINRAAKWARAHNHYPKGLSHAWIGYYLSNLNSDQLCINEWNAMEDLNIDRENKLINFENVPKEKELFIKLIRHKLREILVTVDLEETNSREIRNRLEEETQMDLKSYKEIIDQEMLNILGQLDASSEIFDYLYLGSEWNAANLEELKANNVGFVLNITREIDNFFPGTFVYQNIRLYDLEETELLKHWDDTYKFISNAKNAGKSCLVHCRMGVSRSASTVMAYAMKEYGWTLAEAMKYVKSKRACVQPNAGFWKQLVTYEGILNSSKQRYNKLWRRDSLEVEKENQEQEQDDLMLNDYTCVTLDDIEKPLRASTPTPEYTPKPETIENVKELPELYPECQIESETKEIKTQDDATELKTCMAEPIEPEAGKPGKELIKVPLCKALSAPVTLGLPELRRSVTDLVEAWGKEFSSNTKTSPESSRKKIGNEKRTSSEECVTEEEVVKTQQELVPPSPSLLGTDEVLLTEYSTAGTSEEEINETAKQGSPPSQEVSELDAHGKITQTEYEQGLVKRQVQAIKEKYQENTACKVAGIENERSYEAESENQLTEQQVDNDSKGDSQENSSSNKEQQEDNDPIDKGMDYTGNELGSEDVFPKAGMVKMQKKALEELAKVRCLEKETSACKAKENSPADLIKMLSSEPKPGVGGISPQEKRSRSSSQDDRPQEEVTTVKESNCSVSCTEPVNKARKVDINILPNLEHCNKEDDSVGVHPKPQTEDEAEDIMNIMTLDLDTLEMKKDFLITSGSTKSKEDKEELLLSVGVVRRQKEALESRAKKVNNGKSELKKRRSLQNLDKDEIHDVLQRAKEIQNYKTLINVTQENDSEQNKPLNKELPVPEEVFKKPSAGDLNSGELLTNVESSCNTVSVKSDKVNLHDELKTVEAGIVQRQKEALGIKGPTVVDRERKGQRDSSKEKTEEEYTSNTNVGSIQIATDAVDHTKLEKPKRHTLIVEEIIQDSLTDDESEETVVTESSLDVAHEKVGNDQSKAAITETLEDTPEELVEKQTKQKLDELLATKEEDWQNSNVKRKTLILEEAVRDYTTSSDKSVIDKEVSVILENKDQCDDILTVDPNVRPQSTSTLWERELQVYEDTDSLLTQSEIKKSHKRSSSATSAEILGEEKIVKELVEKFESGKIECVESETDNSDTDTEFLKRKYEISPTQHKSEDDKQLENIYFIGSKEWEEYELLKEKFDSRFK